MRRRTDWPRIFAIQSRDQLTTREVAERFGLSPRTVESRIRLRGMVSPVQRGGRSVQ